jgi:repressor LexA
LRDRILQAIEAYWHEHGRPPTIREIGAAVAIEATSHIAYHVSILRRKGLLSHEPGSRGLTPTRPAGLPVLGTIAAGDPLDQFDAGELEMLDLGEVASAMTTVPRNIANGIYALRVRGTSMIEDGILNGDYVLIAPGPTAMNGEIAVATHNSANGGRGAATLKRVFRRDDGVVLQPANVELEPRFIPAKEWGREWTVQGTVVAVYRQFTPPRATALHRA